MKDMQLAILDIVKRDDINPEKIEKFLDLQFRLQDRQAEESFNIAMANFQKECPIIPKTKKVNFTSSSGKTTKYDYAPLDEIVHIIKPIMAKNGLSFSFNIEERENLNKLITVISHIDGHTKISSLPFDPIHDDTRMNLSQRRKSALSFAKRAALENALGIVTAGEDDDARRAIDQTITEDQINEINHLIKMTSTNEAQFLKFVKVSRLEELSFFEAKKAIIALKEKRSK